MPSDEAIPPFARRVGEAQDVSPEMSAKQRDVARRIRRLQRIAFFMDSSIHIPGLKRTIGFDPLIGLIPVVGDVLSDAVSFYIVYEGWRLGANKKQIAKMLGNIAIDTLVGAVPLLGDGFDFVFKANDRNLRILGIAPNQGIRIVVGSDSKRR